MVTTKTDAPDIPRIGKVKRTAYKEGVLTGIVFQGDDRWMNCTKPEYRSGAWYDCEAGDTVRVVTHKGWIKEIQLVQGDGQTARPGFEGESEGDWEEEPETPSRRQTDERHERYLDREATRQQHIDRLSCWKSAVSFYATKPIREGYDAGALYDSMKALAHFIEADVCR